MRMIWPLVSPAATCTIASGPALLQSWESMYQMISVRPSDASTDRCVPLVSP